MILNIIECDCCDYRVTEVKKDRNFYSLIIKKVDETGDKVLSVVHICALCWKKPLNLQKVLDSAKLKQ